MIDIEKMQLSSNLTKIVNALVDIELYLSCLSPKSQEYASYTLIYQYLKSVEKYLEECDSMIYVENYESIDTIEKLKQVKIREVKLSEIMIIEKNRKTGSKTIKIPANSLKDKKVLSFIRMSV